MNYQTKNSKPLVTIITASYNLIANGRKEFFIQNVKSVQDQTYKNIEHIIIDGASTDGTINLLDNYQKKGWINYYSEPDKGIYHAMNKGILKARGKYVIFLNSDDCYCNNYGIELLIKKAENENLDACYGNTKVVDNKKLLGLWIGRDNFFPWKTNFPCHQTFLIKTDVMKELGLYNLKYNACADNAFLLKLVQTQKKISSIDECIILFRKGGFSDQHSEIVKKEKPLLLYEEYGRFHDLEKKDCEYLVGNKFLSLPLNEAIKLGIKLQKKEWIEQYFQSLIYNHIITNSKKFPLKNTALHTIKQRYTLFNLPILKITKGKNKMKYYLFGIIPFLQYKTTLSKFILKIFGIPIFKIKKFKSGKITKYYIFSIPVFKIIKKGYY